MVAAIEVPIKPETLHWAMKRAAVGVDDLAKAAGVKPGRIAAWLDGRERPTYTQAKGMVKRLRIPLSQLLVPPPERLELPVQDFRRGRVRKQKPSPELEDAIYDALRKRDWYREFRRGQPVPFVGSCSWRQDTPETVTEAILQFVPLPHLQRETSTWAEFIRRAVESVERAGVLVLRQGFVGSNTRRVYNPEEFSGFALADPVAPVIFINGRDPLVRQIFTLAHELVHLWLGQSVLDAALESLEPAQDEVERFCDRVAAVLLMPEETFRSVWSGETYDAAQRAAKRFKVSAWAALRRAWELQLIGRSQYEEALDRIRETGAQKEEPDAGGNFWITLSVRNSPTFTRAVAAAALEGELGPKEVATLLNLRVATALDFLEMMARVSS